MKLPLLFKKNFLDFLSTSIRRRASLLRRLSRAKLFENGLYRSFCILHSTSRVWQRQSIPYLRVSPCFLPSVLRCRWSKWQNLPLKRLLPPVPSLWLPAPILRHTARYPPSEHLKFHFSTRCCTIQPRRGNRSKHPPVQ